MQKKKAAGFIPPSPALRLVRITAVLILILAWTVAVCPGIRSAAAEAGHDNDSEFGFNITAQANPDNDSETGFDITAEAAPDNVAQAGSDNTAKEDSENAAETVVTGSADQGADASGHVGKAAFSTNGIDALMQSLFQEGSFLGAALIVRKDDEVVYKGKWGFADFSRSTVLSYDSIYRIYSMTKPVTAVAVLILSERGLLSIDDPVRDYLPSFADMRVVSDPRFIASGPGAAAEEESGSSREELFRRSFQEGNIQSVPAGRDLTIRDLLTHSSGLGQDICAVFDAGMVPGLGGTLAEAAEAWGQTYLAFEPGSDTGYSPGAGFDVLAGIVETAAGEPFEAFVRREILDPLEMTDTVFTLSDEQKKRLVSIDLMTDAGPVDFTQVWEDEPDAYQARDGFCSGSGGLFSTLEDYEHFAWMLARGGLYEGRRILSPETVALMCAEADSGMINAESPEAWGLGVRIRQHPAQLPWHTRTGTYGWSGTAGTHFFVCPEEQLDCVLMLNRAGIGGNESPVSRAVESAVFDTFAGKLNQLKKL